MNSITLLDLLDKLKEFSKDEKEIVKKAYEYAKNLHDGQVRESGEPYIIHPLNVAYILAEMHADVDTICAALLHDTLEDTPVQKEEIIEEFNKNVASLVDGVTKLAKMNFSSKQAQNLANTRKIITGITEDVRIIIIKLADRLHNMRTLQHKSEFKQKENAVETMEIFVPLAYLIGAYRIKSELEDISFYYLYPEDYKKVSSKKEIIEFESKECLDEMLFTIKNILEDKNIPNDIKVRTKNIYGIWKKTKSGARLYDIHDLLALKIMVEEISQCYQSLGLIHEKYHPINDKFKDHICNPKPNMYRSLHTTVFGPKERLVQTQIRTFDMDNVASFGLSAYWNINQGDARNIMQEELKNKYQFFKSLVQINSMFSDNQEFVTQVKSEIFSNKIYVYTTSGDIIELPKGATPIDFAYKIHTDIGNTMVGAYVNDDYVPIHHQLKNKDRVRIVTDEFSFGPRYNWIDIAITTNAKKKIKEFYNK